MPYCKTNHPRVGSWALSIVLLLLSLSAMAQPPAQVEFVMGAVLISDKQQQTRTAEKGMAVEEGDTVITNDGRVQIRFSDGGYFALQPQSRFRVDEYRYSGGHADTDRVFLSLLQGGLRTISGLIGKRNRPAYRMTTVVATIGIRGTEYVLDLNSALYGHVAQGAIEVCNGAGCLIVPGGQAFSVSSPSMLPVITEKRAILAPPARSVASNVPARSDKNAGRGDGKTDVSVGASNSKGATTQSTERTFASDFSLVPIQAVVSTTTPQADVHDLLIQINVQQAGPTAGQVGAQLASTGNSVGNTVGSVSSTLGNTVGNTVGSVGSALGSVVGNTVGSVGGTLGSVAGNTVGSVGGTVGNVVGNTVGSVGGTVGNVVGNTVGSVGGTVGTIVGNTAGTIGGALGQIGGSLPLVGGLLLGR